jgi:hypothetical protein
MNKTVELKIVKEYLKIVNEPMAYRKKYSTIGTICYAISWFCILGSTVAYLQNHENNLLVSVVGFVGGSTIALGFYFKQLANQVETLSIYLSKEKLSKRTQELSII